MTFRTVTPDEIEELAFNAALAGHPAQIERNPKHHTLHLTLDGVRYSAREAA